MKSPTETNWQGVIQNLAHWTIPNVLSTNNVELVQQNEIPSPQRELLHHEEHMTLVLQRHHGGAVDLHVLREDLTGSCYRRMITLVRRGSGETVEFGLVRIDLDCVPASVRTEILQQSAPLGEILVRHQVLRRVEPRWFLHFRKGHSVLSYFEGSTTAEAYGRIGVIHCNAQPAIELMEVVPR
ncbi:MAG: hypothetical protein AABZ47_02770 [Planctomycetota bacterium]